MTTPDFSPSNDDEKLLAYVKKLEAESKMLREQGEEMIKKAAEMNRKLREAIQNGTVEQFFRDSN